MLGDDRYAQRLGRTPFFPAEWTALPIQFVAPDSGVHWEPKTAEIFTSGPPSSH